MNVLCPMIRKLVKTYHILSKSYWIMAIQCAYDTKSLIKNYLHNRTKLYECIFCNPYIKSSPLILTYSVTFSTLILY